MVNPTVISGRGDTASAMRVHPGRVQLSSVPAGIMLYDNKGDSLIQTLNQSSPSIRKRRHLDTPTWTTKYKRFQLNNAILLPY